MSRWARSAGDATAMLALLGLASLGFGCSLIDDFNRFAGAEASPQLDLATALDGTDDLAGDDASGRDLELADAADLAAPPDLVTIDAARDLAACAPGCIDGQTLCRDGAPLACLLGCLPADAQLAAHCAFVPTGGDLCAGNYLPATVLPGGTYLLDANPKNNNLPRLKSAGGGPDLDGRIAGNRVVFCVESLGQSGLQPVIIDAVTIGYKPSQPLALVARTTIDLPNFVVWAAGSDGAGANGSGLGRNGGFSGAPAGADAPPQQGGGFAGTATMESAGGGGGGNTGGSGGKGAGAMPGSGGKSGALQPRTPGQLPFGGGGGGGGGDATNGAAGGAGGGVVQFAAGLKLRLGGALYVMGGRGGHGQPIGLGGVPGGGGGGGGGGRLLLEAPAIELTGSVCAMVGGGYGGGGGAMSAGSGGSFIQPTMPTCPLAATMRSGGVGGGGAGGPPVTKANDDPKGESGAGGRAGGGGGAGGPGALHLRHLKLSGAINVYPDVQGARAIDPY